MLLSSPAEPLLELLHSRWAHACDNAPALFNFVVSDTASSDALHVAASAVELGLLPESRIWSAPPALVQRIAGTASPPPPSTVLAQGRWPREDSSLLSAPVVGGVTAVPASSPRRVLVLDAVQDPANVASAVRSAAFLGWHGVVLMPGTCQLWRDKVLAGSRLAALALPHLRVQPGQEQAAAAAMSGPGCQLFVTMPPAAPTSEPALVGGPGPPPHTTYLAIGNEGHGVSDQIMRGATHVMSLAGGDTASQHVQSLNAAAAAAVCMAQLGAPPARIQKVSPARGSTG